MIVVFYQNSEKARDDSVQSQFFKYMEFLNNCRSQISCNYLGRRLGQDEVFAALNAQAFEMNIEYQKIQAENEQVISETVTSKVLAYAFLNNAAMPFSKLLSSILSFIEKQPGRVQRDFHDILDSQLTEQNKITFVIQEAENLSNSSDGALALFSKGPFDGYLAIGRNLTRLFQLVKSELDKD